MTALDVLDAGLVALGDIHSIADGRHGDPFAVLGPHRLPAGVVLRVYAPEASAVVARLDDALDAHLTEVGRAGFFAGLIGPGPDVPSYRVRLHVGAGVVEQDDPYRFGLVLASEDVFTLKAGRHWRAHRVLGAHPACIDGLWGMAYAVWAPEAQRVSVVGDFNGWRTDRHPMRLRHDAGVWEIFLPDVSQSATYAYDLAFKAGGSARRRDPYAQVVLCAQGPASRPLPLPLGRPERPEPRLRHGESSIRLLSGDLREDSGAALVAAASRLGASHIQLASVCPDADKFGAPSAIFSVDEAIGHERLSGLLDRANLRGIGVLLEWDFVRFSAVEAGLGAFDGSRQYERPGLEQAAPVLAWNHARWEAANHLLANGVYWLSEVGFDGLVVHVGPDPLQAVVTADFPPDPDHPTFANATSALPWVLRQACELSRGAGDAVMVVGEALAQIAGACAATRHGGLGFSHVTDLTLAPLVAAAFAPDADHGVQTAARRALAHAGGRSTIARLALGPDGEIDPVSSAILAVAPLGLSVSAKAAQRGPWLRFLFDLHARLAPHPHWRVLALPGEAGLAFAVARLDAQGAIRAIALANPGLAPVAVQLAPPSGPWRLVFHAKRGAALPEAPGPHDPPPSVLAPGEAIIVEAGHER